jgi:hypothetical protein
MCKWDGMEDARKIIDDHIRSATICMITMDILQWSLKPEALSRQWQDDDGNIWFTFFDNESGIQPVADGHMEAFYSNVQTSKFMSLVGFASRAGASEVHATHPAFPALGMPDAEIPFQLVKFIPDRAFYWDSEKDDMISIRLRDDFQHHIRYDELNRAVTHMTR